MKLVHVNGPQEGIVHHLRPPGVAIGRAADNDVVLDDIKVSQYHAKVEHVDGRWHVRDLDSTNGVQLNGAPVKQHTPLSVQDELLVGDARLLFTDDTHQPAPIPGPLTDDAPKKPTTGNRTVRVRILLAMLVAMLALLGGVLVISERNNATRSTTPTIVVPNDRTVDKRLKVRYEKLDATNESVFRYVLSIENQGLSVTVDDLKNQRRIHESATLNDSDYDELNQFVLAPAFLALQPLPAQSSDGKQTRRTLRVQQVNRGNYIQLINTRAPAPFSQLASRLEQFAEHRLLLGDVAVSRDQLVAMSKEKFLYAERKFHEREVQAGNLYSAIEAYRYSLDNLKNLDNKPTFFEHGHRQLNNAEALLQKQLEEWEYSGQMHQRMGDYHAARDAYQRILNEVPDRDNEFVRRARRQMRTLGKLIQQKKKKRS